ncbi:MAG: hypothetical protein LBC02_08640 [Planctomycetaceae bacterium]|nr:hypothetical protein [Planctomycetaceae bacterium]
MIWQAGTKRSDRMELPKTRRSHSSSECFGNSYHCATFPTKKHFLPFKV